MFVRVLGSLQKTTNKWVPQKKTDPDELIECSDSETFPKGPASAKTSARTKSQQEGTPIAIAQTKNKIHD